MKSYRYGCTPFLYHLKMRRCRYVCFTKYYQQRNNPETLTPSQKLDDDKLTELLSQAIDVTLQSRLYDDEKYVDKLVSVFTELANMYNIVTANCNKNAETINRNIQLTEKRYAAMMKLIQAKKSKAIEQPPIPQTMKALPRFIFMTYPWYWIKRMYRSKHSRLFLVICMACTLAVSVFLTIFLAYDNAQLRKEICRKCYTLIQ